MKRVFAVAAVSLVAAVLAMAGATAQAGHPDGGLSKMDSVNPDSYDTYRVVFYGGEFAQVRVHGYGRTVLALAVYDSAGNLVVVDNDRDGSDCLVTWVPPYNQTYTIRVINPASISNTYWVSTN